MATSHQCNKRTVRVKRVMVESPDVDASGPMVLVTLAGSASLELVMINTPLKKSLQSKVRRLRRFSTVSYVTTFQSHFALDQE